jgi:hypothetical protein
MYLDLQGSRACTCIYGGCWSAAHYTTRARAARNCNLSSSSIQYHMVRPPRPPFAFPGSLVSHMLVSSRRDLKRRPKYFIYRPINHETSVRNHHGSCRRRQVWVSHMLYPPAAQCMLYPGTIRGEGLSFGAVC